MMGDVNYFSVTPNGQYVFSAVSRPKYFLASMERLVLTCDTLAKSPDNQFLAAWKPACASTPVRWSLTSRTASHLAGGVFAKTRAGIPHFN